MTGSHLQAAQIRQDLLTNKAVPGDGVLSRYTRPSFLQWESALGALLLGTKVCQLIGDAARAVDVEVAGYLARPLYVCTNASPKSKNEMCMSIASMSRFVQQAPGQVHYRCSDCVAKSAGVPVSDSTPLRVLHLYALIYTKDGDFTPMRMRPVRLVVCAPPDTCRWGGTVTANLQDESMANPTQATERRSDFFQYNKEESDALWSRSSCFRGEGHDSDGL